MGEWIKCSERIGDGWVYICVGQTVASGQLSRNGHVMKSSDPWLVGEKADYWQHLDLPDPPKREPEYRCPFCGAHSVFACHIAAGMFQAKCAACCAKGSVEDGEAAAMAHFAVKEG